MIEFTATILQFAEKGEKTGWTYINIPQAVAQQLSPGNKKAFRVKGWLDDYRFTGVSLTLMGSGYVIMALNAAIRKGIGKTKGAQVNVQIEVDENELKPPAELIACLEDEPEAFTLFKSFSKSHQNYFTNWINAAKTDETKTKRIAHTITALLKGYNYGQMIRALKNNRTDLRG